MLTKIQNIFFYAYNYKYLFNRENCESSILYIYPLLISVDVIELFLNGRTDFDDIFYFVFLCESMNGLDSRLDPVGPS